MKLTSGAARNLLSSMLHVGFAVATRAWEEAFEIPLKEIGVGDFSLSDCWSGASCDSEQCCNNVDGSKEVHCGCEKCL
jgi:hypothetical protein